MSEDIDKKLKFIQDMTKHGLQHFDSGGTVQPTNGGILQNNTMGAPSNVGQGFGDLYSGNVGGLMNNIGNSVQSTAADFTAQNGYQAQLAPTQTSNYGNVINQSAGNALGGYGNFQNIQGQQQGLANQLQAETQGAGPNPAQQMLNNATGQNVANQAALMAGQRGASNNPGMIARQNSQQGANIQQNAAGQAAVINAQQQLAAQQQLQQQQSTMGQQNIGEQGANNQLFGAGAAAQNAQNNSMISNYGMAQGINSNIAQNNANSVNQTLGGFMGGASSMMSMLSKGGVAGKDGKSHLHHIASIYHAKKFDDGGIAQEPNSPSISISVVPSSSGSGQSSGSSKTGSGAAGLMSAMKAGGKVPGKAKVKGNSEKNDTVPALLSAGEIVLPRSVTTSEDAPRKAAEFVAAVMAKKRMKKNG